MIRELSGTHSVVNTVRAVLFSVHVGLLSILSADWFSRAAVSLRAKPHCCSSSYSLNCFFFNALCKLGASLHSHLQQCHLFLGFFSSSVVR